VNKTLICFALAAEAKPFRKAVIPRLEAQVVVTGMGMANARKAIAEALPLYRPRQVLTCGLAGALAPRLRLNDVVFDADPDFPLTWRLQASEGFPARFYCSPAIVSTAPDKERVRQTTGADVVDMESEVIRDECRKQGIPSATVRVISDLADETLPLDFNRYLNTDMSMNIVKIGLSVLARPGILPLLLRFQKQTNAAAAKLGAFLAALLRDSE
jgi:nucleoside phosphorylase